MEPATSRSLEELHQALFEQAADGMFVAGTQGHYLEINRSGCKMLGHTHREMLHLSWQELIPAEGLET